MSITTSELFGFLEEHPVCSVERHEIAEPHFDALRRSLRGIVARFSDCNDAGAQDISDRIRVCLSEWLTVPIPFDKSILDAVQSLGNSDEVKRKWGEDIGVFYEGALEAARALPAENPVRIKLRSAISGLIDTGRTFRIYCHRRARRHFESLLVNVSAPLCDTSFLHTLRDYREAEPFHVLIKVGPLRSRGWGSVPDALISAPRFDTLLQVVWCGCRDEPGFGYDPVAPSSEIGLSPEKVAAVGSDVLANMISWRTVTFSDRDTGGCPGETDPDEFQLFAGLSQSRQGRAAMLVEIDRAQGILLAPRCEVLSFDPMPDAEEPIQFRYPIETLVAGMFVIIPLHTDADLGGLEARKGIYSRAWKTRLAEMYQADPDGLVSRLRSEGLELLDLHASIERWSSSLDDVLPAPGKMKHFHILIEALDVNWGGNAPAETGGTVGWKRAWMEIRHARGEAIQIGRDEHELIDEELVAIVKSLLPEIRNLSASNDTYVLSIPSGRGLRGILRFYKVDSVEEGFLAPEFELGFVQELSTIEQWRV